MHLQEKEQFSIFWPKILMTARASVSLYYTCVMLIIFSVHKF